jgi:hypothetical protein
MANQNPQPEVYTTRHNFAAATTQGTADTQTIFTNQATNEEVRIYSVSVSILDSSGVDTATDTNDFSIQTRIGNGLVPYTKYDAGLIQQMDDKTMTFATPMLILFQQPLSVTVAWENSQNSDAEVTVIVSFHAELSLQPVACHKCGTMYPQNSGCPICRRGA